MTTKKALLALWMFALVLSTEAKARLPPRASDLGEKVRGSELVLVVTSLGVETQTELPLKGERVERLRIVDIVKGEPDGRVLLFVTAGVSAEARAPCCDVGNTYLVFLNRGYPVFEEKFGQFAVTLMEQETYVSGADNASSAYKLCGENVLGWNVEGSSNAELRDVKAEIQGLAH